MNIEEFKKFGKNISKEQFGTTFGMQDPSHITTEYTECTVTHIFGWGSAGDTELMGDSHQDNCPDPCA